jgi:hypothetical protein
MNRRTIIILLAVAFGLGASTATLAWLWSGYTKEAALANGRPAWIEVA